MKNKRKEEIGGNNWIRWTMLLWFLCPLLKMSWVPSFMYQLWLFYCKQPIVSNSQCKNNNNPKGKEKKLYGNLVAQQTDLRFIPAADFGMNSLQPFSILSHSIKDANTLECLIGLTLPRSITWKGTGEEAMNVCWLTVATKPLTAGKGGSLKWNPTGERREWLNAGKAVPPEIYPFT